MVALCPNLRLNGLCGDAKCDYRHDMRVCEPCGLVFLSEAIYNSHVGGKRHASTVDGQFAKLFCPICERRMDGLAWRMHVVGKPHCRAAARKGVSPDVQAERENPGETVGPGFKHCGLCERDIPLSHWSSHEAGAKHRAKERFATYKAVIGEAVKDKHGVAVSNKDDGLDFGIVSNSEAASGRTAHLTVKVAVPNSKVVIREIRMTSRVAHPSFTINTASLIGNRLVYGRDYAVPITLRSSNSGHHDDRVEITFEDTQLNQQFVIVRFMRVIVGNKADYDRLKPTMAYTPRVRSKREPEIEVVPGEAPPALDAMPYVVKLSHAHIPKNILSVLATGSTQDKAKNLRRTVLPTSLDVASYSRHFKTLLWVEEKRSEDDLEIYDIVNANLTKHGPYYHLDVPGLAEKRPSVLVGDRILVQRHGSEKGHWFEGHVHFVERDHVGLRFHSSFPGHSANHRYHVRFKLNRIPLRRQHQALDAALRGEHLFFPEVTHVACSRTLSTTICPYNSDIASNPAQMQAIASILDMKQVSVPFVVFGPPGTGKTVTIVETIRQIMDRDPNARILACAPSNSAADHIAESLTMYGNDKMLRYYAPSRPRAAVPDALIDFTYERQLELDPSKWFMRNRYFSVPPMPQLRRFRIIVSTCVSASFAYNVGLPRGHFTHIFVDEAGQATEPEVMISVKTMADDKTKIVLSGDPKQLGPIIRCPIARELDLDISYLERLMNRDIYLEDSGNTGITFVKLVKNFRSHGSILKFPNEQFYRGDLQVSGSPQKINSYLQWTHLPKRDFPIIFHGIRGKDDRESTSPSFFNISEALQVKDYVTKLRDDRRIRIADTDIGVITPYHAQCLKIRTALRGMGDGVKVGSTEEFQGQERRVIIISTVRSSKDYVNYDLRHTLGFVANPRRFNGMQFLPAVNSQLTSCECTVAVTRAQALLIIIGDPSVLSLDPLWRSFLNYIHLNGGWKGEEPTWDTHEDVRSEGGYDQELRQLAIRDMNEFAERLESYARTEAAAEDVDGEDGDENVDRPWRELE
ncbi:P-loop containing nucleoside triphosphate hydrolase protein [Heliocybe sulcata]|uniref:RNA helicase n=1 Tax=Heliocybe sulcata TaxID=5364 RepID=A0A5C3MWP5_9AGAM|nr:P-loop containing nucleoside triphosphate hydrolase protein [Heliocybe sulcata]